MFWIKNIWIIQSLPGGINISKGSRKVIFALIVCDMDFFMNYFLVIISQSYYLIFSIIANLSKSVFLFLLLLVVFFYKNEIVQTSYFYWSCLAPVNSSSAKHNLSLFLFRGFSKWKGCTDIFWIGYITYRINVFLY